MERRPSPTSPDCCGISRVEPCDTDHGAARNDERAVRTALRLALRVLDEL